MKRMAMVWCALLCVAPAVRSAGAQSAAHRAAAGRPQTLQETLVALEKQSWEAWKARDSAFYRRFLSDDHVELGFGGSGNKAEVIATVGTPRCVVSSYEVGDFKLSAFSKETALLTYHASQATVCSGKPVPSPVWVSSLYVHRNGRWVNAAYQQTQDMSK
jgi:hypothetical protein